MILLLSFEADFRSAVCGASQLPHCLGTKLSAMRTLGRIVALCFTKRIIPPILLLLLSAAPACNWFRDFDFARGARVTGGNPELGRKQLAQHSCGSCHTIPGVPKAEGKSAGSLAGWSGRSTFLNRFPNTPESLEQWLENPSHRKPGTNMPNLNISQKDSRDIAAYLFSIN
jgi:cytochrome c2